MKKAIVMNPKDNVATALDDLKAGDKITVVSSAQEVVKEVTVTKPIPFGHKLALNEISKGAEVIKYGEIIGRASQDISLGDHVHVHNVDSARIPMPKAVREQEV